MFVVKKALLRAFARARARRAKPRAACADHRRSSGGELSFVFKTKPKNPRSDNFLTPPQLLKRHPTPYTGSLTRTRGCQLIRLYYLVLARALQNPSCRGKKRKPKRGGGQYTLIFANFRTDNTLKKVENSRRLGGVSKQKHTKKRLRKIEITTKGC